MKKLLISLLALPFLVFSQNKLTPELLWKLGRVSEPQLSPDGKYVLYSVKTYDLTTNKGNTDIWKMDVSGSNAVKLAGTESDESSARWLNQDKIIYVSDETGSPQLWTMKADGSSKKTITKIFDGINEYGFNTQGDIIWFSKDVKQGPDIKDKYPDLPLATGKIYDDLMMRHWNVWEDEKYSHVFVSNLIGDSISKPVDVMPGEKFDTPMKPFGGSEQVSMSPDGKMIAYTCKKLSGTEYAVSTNSEIYIYDFTARRSRNMTEGMPGYDTNPAFSPDGKQLIWLSMQTATYEADRNRIFLYDFATGTKREITEGFRYSVDKAMWSPDGKKIYFLSGINATDQLFSYDLASGAKTPRQITNDAGDHTDFTVAGKGPSIVTAMMSISSPTELFSIDEKSGASKKISKVNDDVLKNVQMGRVEKRMIKATDGKEILTWVIYPPDFTPGFKYPALLYCQGGPQSTVSQFFSYRWNFQLMAANGYVVVAPNRRGLPSFGEEWNREISGDWGGQAMRDLLSAIDSVSKEPYINKDKLGAVGASFGGYSVYWLAGNHNKRFKAFIAHCGVFNLESMYGATEELWFPDFDLGGPYWKSPAPISYSKFSPHHFVRSWDTPMLIIHNEKDFRVPLTQGMEAFTAARVQNIPARFLYFPDEGHWVNKPQNSVMWQRVFFEWLNKYLKS